MAKIDTIVFDPTIPDGRDRMINVSATVGANGVNHQDDVIAVQALLKYALQWRNDFKGEEFPEPSGAFIKATAHLIKKYQRHMNRKSHNMSIDGRIDPAKSGIYAYGTKKIWTIYALHVDSIETALLSGHKTPIDGICKRWPFMEAILEKQGVGSLNLALE
ncbi:MAG: hypothetical protein R2747_09360 [Pyrinomonadaceae bacterium]